MWCIIIFLYPWHSYICKISSWFQFSLRHGCFFSVASHSVQGASTLLAVYTILFVDLGSGVACRNLCERFDSKFTVGEAHYGSGKKYCRRSEVYFFHDGTFCPRSGMSLRHSHTGRRVKEKLRRRNQLLRKQLQGILNRGLVRFSQRFVFQLH